MSQIEVRKIADLAPYERNARVHSPEQIAQLVASIKEFGFTNPILISPEGMVVAGHGRLEAAKEAGLEEVPTLAVGADWSPEKIRAYVLADNKLALNASWDDAILKAELADLSDFGIEIDLIGFTPADLSLIFGEVPTIEGLPSGAGSSAPAADGEKRRTLMERFGLAPFSVLSARGGWWQDRKRAWLALGIESEVGRGENLLRFSDTINEPDPVKRAAMQARKAAAADGAA